MAQARSNAGDGRRRLGIGTEAMAAASDLRTLRVDLIGGMRRPEHLQEARARRDHGELSDGEFQKILDAAVRDLIDKEEAHGLPVVTDGEFRRHNFQESFGGAVTGFDAAPYIYEGPRWDQSGWRPGRIE